MQLYTVQEVFEILKENKITSHIESVRRWLRDGTIEGIPPIFRKEGWKVTKESLDQFLEERLPTSFTTNDVKRNNKTSIVLNKEQIRAEMWMELAQKNIWEGYVEIKKGQLHECIQHRKYSKQLEERVWKCCVANSPAYKRPRVFYLLEAFFFEGERLLLDPRFERLEEQMLFSIIEYVRVKN
ncbi:helix-turn-helix domain-containing protein [Niallia sp. 01092]|uniref:helix-turn-helix domain-containing protein n=1 Tax=Niallia sp. 01092 TaxID=3457759 RepID=UPI003FD62498